MRLALAAGSVIAVASLIVAFLPDFGAAPAGRTSSIAILPFENLSPAPDDSFFASGLYEEIINHLEQIPDLRVISRSSVQKYAGSPAAISDIANALNVEAVMEGSVHFEDERVRISARLVDPDDGAQLWSEMYEREFSDIFAIQSEIAASVAGALGISLGVRNPNVFSTGTTNLDAFRAYLAGLHMMRQPHGEDRGSFFFKRAAEIDPDYAAAWTQLGFATVIRAYNATPEQARSILDEALTSLTRATELDPRSARVAATLGFVRYSLLDWVGAEKDFARAIDLRADNFSLTQHASLLVRSGRMTAAKSEFDAGEAVVASRSEPGQLRRHVSVAMENYSEARELVALERIDSRRQLLLLNIALNEGYSGVIKSEISTIIEIQGETAPFYSAVLREIDSPDKALEVIRAARADNDVQWPAKQFTIALFAAYFGDPHLALESISEEVRLATVRLWVLWYPIMSEVRQLPEFKDLVISLNLVEYWRMYGWPDVCAPTGQSDFRCW
ncbi:MAG: hypothetical protein OEQ14_05785 [Gammaproteobacteria bacterium]|nr:hypothetical protein [Gammaproteobacteria bacterium]